MKAPELALYRDLLVDIKTRVRQAQRRAVVSANAHLHNELPELKGFSESNLKRMVHFCLEYPGLGPIGAQAAPQITAGASVVRFSADLNTPMEVHPSIDRVENYETEPASGLGMEHTA